MQPLNTSPSNISFGGILEPLVQNLEKLPRQNGRLTGHEIVMHGSVAQAIIALDNENSIHLLLTPAGDSSERFSKLSLKGLSVAVREWMVGEHPARPYLDVACATGTLPSFKRPFLRFAEDVLQEILQTQASPDDAVYRTGIRWRHFWSPDSTMRPSTEWMYGIFGELSFLADIITRSSPKAVQSWTGPMGKDHDFQTGTEVAFEVKASAEVPFRIHCNIRQLDHRIFNDLFLVCYKLAPSEAGKTLPEIVSHIEVLIANDEIMLDGFYERLGASGYLRSLEPVYKEMPLSCSRASVFRIDDAFPKITEGSFLSPPDHRITAVRYTLQVTGVDELDLDDIPEYLSRLSK
jgi:hypothetical protein